MTSPTDSADLYAGKVPHVAGSDTSLAAAEHIEPHASSMRARAHRMIVQAGDNGITVDEMEAATGSKHQTISARVVELAQAGLVRDSMNRRRTRSGCYAVVYVAAKDGDLPLGPTRVDWHDLATRLHGLLLRIDHICASVRPDGLRIVEIAQLAAESRRLVTVAADGTTRPAVTR